MRQEPITSSFSLPRVLAKGATDESESIDYTILVYVFITLALLMIIEIIRKYLDRLAHGKKVFVVVLQVLYEELSTLGILSAAIFLIHVYPNPLFYIEPKAELAFEKVHFALFFMVIINAIQNIVLYYMTLRVVNKNWVRVENVNLDHYVAIRNQFVSVSNQLQDAEKNMKWFFAKTKNDTHTSLWDDIRLITTFRNMFELIHYPKLKLKHRKLLVQIRFHELRVHFIEANDLPSKFRVSAYLKKSLDHSFVSFIEISSIVWITLLGGANLMYYLSGLISYFNGDVKMSGHILTYIFFLFPFAFLFVSLIIYRKLKIIFYKVINEQKWGCTENSNKTSYPSNHLETSRIINERDRQHQLDFFWGGDPQYIVRAAQLMLFGFAAGFAIFLIFHQVLEEKRSYLKSEGWYISIPLGWIVFLYMWSYMIPAYIQCTRLGALINKDHLMEAEAECRLEQEKRNREAQLLEDLFVKKVTKKPSPTSASERQRKILDRSVSMQLETISKLAKTKTDDLPTLESDLSPKKSASERKKSRLKSLSTGISEMRYFHVSKAAQEVLNDAALSPSSELTKERRQRFKSLSTGIPSSPISSLFPRHDVTETHAETLHDSDQNGNHDDSSVRSEASFTTDTLSPQTVGMKTDSRWTNFKIRSIITSRHFRITSDFFMTTLTFFLVGMRVEYFLIDNLTLQNTNTTWHLNNSNAFWVEFALLCLLILGACVGILVYMKHVKNYAEIAAYATDFALSGSCLAILLVAEAKRCTKYTEKSCDHYLSCTPPYKCDPIFGSCTCGGLGSIEPFTALIGLRPVALFIIRRIFLSPNTVVTSGNVTVSRHDSILNRHSVSSSRDVDKKNKILTQKGTITELWMKAVVTFPDIAKTHGMFSEQLLKAMLNISESTAKNIDTPLICGGKKASSVTRVTSLALSEHPNVLTIRKPSMQRARSVLTEGLMFGAVESSHSEDPGCDFVARNATLVRSMRRCEQKFLPLIDQWTAVDVLLTNYEIVWLSISSTDGDDERAQDELKDKIIKSHGGKGMRLSDVTNGRTVLGHMALKDIKKITVQRQSPQVTPTTPIDSFETSAAVDDAEIGDIGRGSFNRNPLSQGEFWESNQDNKGTPSHSDRWKIVAPDSFAIGSDDGVLVLLNQISEGEHWNSDPSKKVELSPSDRWQRVTQDLLMIESDEGILVLRFLVDLCDEEDRRKSTDEVTNGDDENDQSLKTQGALLWCQTIAHIVGRDNLRQRLPNFGQNNNAELLDFLVSMDRARGKSTRNLVGSASLATRSMRKSGRFP